jgi:ribose transport system permease protein
MTPEREPQGIDMSQQQSTGTPQPPVEHDGAPDPAPSGESGSGRRRPRIDVQVGLLWLLFLIAIPASRVVSDSFPSGAQLEAISTLGLFLIVLAFGEGLVILTGGIDLSIPAVAASAAYACAWLVSSGTSPLLAIIIGLGVALVIGLVSGLGVSFLKIPPFIMTLAVSTIVASALLGLNKGRPARPAPDVLPTLFGKGNHVLGLPVPLFFLIGVVLGGFAIQSLTSFGRRVYAVGSSERAARVSGVGVGTTLTAVYVVAALFYGIGGIMLLGFAGNARLELGREYLLPAIAAVLVGGTAIAGGRGSFLGTVGGGLLLTAISVDISAADVAEGWKQVLYGAIVLATLMLSRVAGLGIPGLKHGSRAEARAPEAVPARE